MFCEVRRSFARISPVLCCSREREELLFGNFFRAPTIPCFRRPKKDPTRELWYFARNAPWCFSSDVARPPCSLSTCPFSISPSYDLNSLDHIFAMFRSSNFRPPPTLPSSFYYFSSFFLATSAGTLVPFPLIVAVLPPPVLLQPRKSKLDAKTRPNVHNARRPTYRVSGTIASGHRFPPPGWDKCEDMLPENARRLVPRLSCNINLDCSWK